MGYDKTVLVVDDEEYIREPAARAFTRKGFKQVFTAAKANEALEIIGREKPNLILMDIQLKDEINGVEILKRTKKEVSPASCVVMISGYSEGYKEECQQLGCADFLEKPIGLEEVIPRCIKALGL